MNDRNCGDVFEQLPQKPMYNYVNSLFFLFHLQRAIKKHRACDFFPLHPPVEKKKHNKTEKIKTTCSICFNTAGHINKNRGCVIKSGAECMALNIGNVMCCLCLFVDTCCVLFARQRHSPRHVFYV